METNLEEILNPGAHIYFVGIGGIAMSAAASICKEAGFEVSGSDSKGLYSPAKDVLDSGKINYFVGYDQKQAEDAKADLYVLSAGEDESNPEVKYIVDNNLPRVGFAEVMHFLAKDKLRIVVTGTHGKSTTAGLLGHTMKSLDNSSFLAGGVLQNYKRNFYFGDGHYFTFEGDEYKNLYDDPTPKFHYYKPDILLLTNLEYDHPDIFGSLEELEDEFRQLIAGLPEDGLIIYNADDINLSRLVQESNVSSASFGIDNEADFKVENLDFGSDFTTIEIHNKFSKTVSSKLLGQTEQYKIQLPGKINVYNALGVIALVRSLGFTQDQIALDLLSYAGIKRRFELVGQKNEIILIDDYAHHPTAVKETLEAAKLKYPGKKLWAVFEPHTFSRTKATLEELAKAFDSADQVLISEIYPAREKASEATIKSQEVVEAIKANQKNIRLVSNKQQALEILKAEAKPGDVIITMAVGDFNRLPYELKEIL